ncbi:acyl-CoA dehydratase activase [bacterium]|uniref:acyl-CoA dehydratase activase n=1 Tax=Lachnospiraceae TaxID=186803 RepID=UPI002A7CEAD0|nr:acyl-CoA dehydratase activase [bacterium]MCI7150444.1 acyl-CoA dehydratase activase [bacterium]MDY2885537.1 acyl-CoA dehydratase activase [Bariatricus sp.]MDY4195328.1 acyl-CoA dehydratase activase [Bariatricus sp.]MDY4504017.1 acyl-CoA dehydratase activase [Bariatricus sp.]
MYQVGIDIGSSAAKAVVMNEGEVVRTLLLNTGFNSRKTAEEIYETFKNEGITKENARYVATGYGRISVPYADDVITEITCHGKGAAFLFHEDGTVIDIGGQDTKGISLKKGRVMKFIMNDKCSAGTGKFLEVMTNRLGLTQNELSELARKGNPITISSMCTVFAESEVISLIGKGTPREDIAYGVIESVVTKVVQLISQVPAEQYFLTGGLCEDEYIIERLVKALGAPVSSAPLARYAGAVGAALMAE